MLWVIAPQSQELVQAPTVVADAVQAEGQYNPYTSEGPSPASPSAAL